MTERISRTQFKDTVSKSSVSKTWRAVYAPPSKDKPAKRSKFRNVKTTVDGIVFDSVREARHWVELQAFESSGQIHKLKRQVPYELHVNGIKVCKIIPDFEYWIGDQLIVADSKGMRTPMYNLKKKMLAAEYGLDILEM